MLSELVAFHFIGFDGSAVLTYLPQDIGARGDRDESLGHVHVTHEVGAVWGFPHVMPVGISYVYRCWS